MVRSLWVPKIRVVMAAMVEELMPGDDLTTVVVLVGILVGIGIDETVGRSMVWPPSKP